jgi:crotonobetainyl-CoA:carnitine CoA-transferase CaiB-like acyl-CoA transferase
MDIMGGDLFSMINQGKRSLALDLKTDAGRDVFLDLVAEADVVFESFRPSVVERLGIGYEACRSINDDVVYCALSGHGATGPDQDQPGHDLNYAATIGLLDMTRPSPDDPPVIPGFPVADMASGLFAAFSIVSSLLSRELGNQEGE